MNDAAEKPAHWSGRKEQAAGYWLLKFLLILFRLLPVIFLRVLAFPVGLFYFLFSRRNRSESRRFLRRAAPFAEDAKTAKRCLSPLGPLRHIISFSLTLVEKMQSWGGKFFLSGIHFQDDDIRGLGEILESGKGAFLITSHLGNAELLRALVNLNRTSVSKEVPITAILNVKVTEHFDRIIKELNPSSTFDVIGANEIGPDTAILLGEKLASGHMVTMAADRTSSGSFGKNFTIPFLGKEAPFSPGAFYMAALLEAPLFAVFAMRRGDLSLRPGYDMYVHKIDFAPAVSRKERTELSCGLARTFAGFLEAHCKKNPFQWYNFYDFWSED